MATYLIGKQPKVEAVPVYFDNYPLSGRTTKMKALRCCSRLAELLEIKEAYAFPNGQNLIEFIKLCERKLTCVLCRRMMLRLAEKFAEEIGAAALVTGESLGQVASQTLTNIRAEDSAVRIPVLRPLIGLDKREIVDIARRIGTYPDSVLPASCCSSSPRKPATKARFGRVIMEEGKVDMPTLLSRSFQGRERIALPI